MGDIVHSFPAISQIYKHFPQAQIDWVVEEEFSSLPLLHRGIQNIRVTNWRKLKKKQISIGQKFNLWRILKEELRSQNYDLAIDLQGLLKSALVGRKIGASLHGPKKGRDPFASFFYNKHHSVLLEEKNCIKEGYENNIPIQSMHIIPRLMQLCGAALGYKTDINDCDYGVELLHSDKLNNTLITKQNKVFLCHSASKANKELPEKFWQDLISRLITKGYHCILPGHSNNERARAYRLIGVEKNGDSYIGKYCSVLPRLSISSMAQIILKCEAVVSLDTGLAHLATALGVKTISVYLTSNPLIFGCYGTNALNISTETNPKLRQYPGEAKELLPFNSLRLKCLTYPTISSEKVIEHIQ